MKPYHRIKEIIDGKIIQFNIAPSKFFVSKKNKCRFVITIPKENVNKIGEMILTGNAKTRKLKKRDINL